MKELSETLETLEEEIISRTQGVRSLSFFVKTKFLMSPF